MDFINHEGWKYFGVIGLNRKLYRTRRKDKPGVFEKLDNQHFWIKIDYLPKFVVPYMYKKVSSKYFSIPYENSILFKEMEFNGEFYYYI